MAVFSPIMGTMIRTSTASAIMVLSPSALMSSPSRSGPISNLLAAYRTSVDTTAQRLV